MIGTLFLIAALAMGESEPASLNLESLLREMVDRSVLARLPSANFRAVQFSSYDRASTDPSAPGWFANWDRSMFLRTETRGDRTEHVLVDAKGPGAVVRFWATWDGARGQTFSDGMLRIYLDGEEEARFAGPISSMISGGLLAPPPLSQFVAPNCPVGNRAHNLYLPIPFAQRCLITYETSSPIDPGATKGGEALYYQVQCRLYDEGTIVHSLTPDALASLRTEIEATAARLSAGEDEAMTGSVRHPFEGVLEPSAEQEFMLAGPGAVARLELEIQAADPLQALRSTMLELRFDGEVTSSVPVGAFFGGGCATEPSATWSTRSSGGSMRCDWVMPYAREMRLRLVNLGEERVSFKGSAAAMPWVFDDRSLYFHATWREYRAHATRELKGDGSHAEDLSFVRVEGSGWYVGDSLEVFNTAAAWWGEGDEKITVDDEEFPSFFGTGTEDYYGYAWCRPEPFSAPFHAQPTGAGNFVPGRTVNMRLRALDAIPFRSSIDFDMELWHWAPAIVNWAPTCWFYARPGAVTDAPPDLDAMRAPIARTRSDLVEVFQAPGALEGEAMKIVSRSGGVTEVQFVPQFRWSNDQQIWWRDGKDGDELVLSFSAPAAGRYRVIASLTRAVDYAIVHLFVNGLPADAPFDGYGEGVTHGEVDLGIFDLPEGRSELRVQLRGANPRAASRGMFGLDFLRLAAP